MKILLVGGAGFIGSHLALKLAENNQVSVVDNLQVNNFTQLIESQTDGNKQLYIKFLLQRFELMDSIKNIKLFCVDARDYMSLSNIVEEVNPDVVIHLAAVSHAGKAQKSPYTTFDHSLRTLENALDISVGIADQFIYFSSSMVYGDFRTEQVKETENLNPKGIYGVLKKVGEEIVREYSKTIGLPYTIIRPSALYGERCISRRVIQIFIENVLKRKPIKIQDEDERLDFTYISDLVEGVALVVGNKKAYNETFNMTFGESKSIKELLEDITCYIYSYDQNLLPLKKIKVKKDKTYPKRGTLNINKARNLLGYEPRYDLYKGISEYFDWYKEML